jgi:hypothetical protein
MQRVKQTGHKQQGCIVYIVSREAAFYRFIVLSSILGHLKAKATRKYHKNNSTNYLHMATCVRQLIETKGWEDVGVGMLLCMCETIP